MIRKYSPKATDPIVYAWVVGITAALLLAVALILGPVWLQSVRDRDTEGTGLRTGTAWVTGITYPSATRKSQIAMPLIGLKLNGVAITTPYPIPPKPGTMVRVEYRVGKSGQIYVEKILSDSDR